MNTYQTQATLDNNQTGFGHTRRWNDNANDTSAAISRPMSKAEGYAKAAEQMKQGKVLVIVGFAVMVIGMIAYCAISIGTETNQDFGLAFLANSSWMIAPALITMGIGSLVWLAGSFLYFVGGLDSDPNGPDLYF